MPGMTAWVVMPDDYLPVTSHLCGGGGHAILFTQKCDPWRSAVFAFYVLSRLLETGILKREFELRGNARLRFRGIFPFLRCVSSGISRWYFTFLVLVRNS